jgi:hypothetical protein
MSYSYPTVHHEYSHISVFQVVDALNHDMIVQSFCGRLSTVVLLLLKEMMKTHTGNGSSLGLVGGW